MSRKINTNLLHSYPVNDKYTGAASIPKYQVTTFDQKNIYVDAQKYCYSRMGNPTLEALQEAIKQIENAEFAYVFSSGMAAVTTSLMLFKQGDHVIFPKEVYGGTYQFASKILPKYGISASFLDYRNIDLIKENIKENTRCIYIETPSNPLLKVSDIERIIALAKEHKLLTIADNTFMTPIYQKPLAMGCDIVVESLTKFINGHSDVLGGSLVTNDEELAKEISLLHKNFGAVMGTEDAWLVLRSIKTLGLRLEKATSNAEQIAKYLINNPKIKKVYYPGLDSHENNDIHTKQASSGGAVLSFELFSEEERIAFLERIKLPIFAISLGGVESIISHPATMSHACMSASERAEQGISDNLLRLSCGIEDVDDLIEDLEQALK